MSELHINNSLPHFDARLTTAEAKKLVSNPELVSHHPFYPFLQRNQRWTKFAKKGARGDEVKEKDRPIRYAARRDSCIFSHYRELLSPLYERELERLALTECVLAYRHIPVPGKKSGKCNIHFASQAFQLIRELGNCCALALDIRQFFENLDHNRIKQNWCRLLGPHSQGKKWFLPDDHFRVFESVTRYSYIDRNCAYEALGLIGETLSSSGERGIKYLVSRENFPKQICTPPVFREKLTALIKINPDPWGIPQGSPISDLLANLYMIDFDAEMNAFARSKDARYFRYSDDILLVLPGSKNSWREALRTTESILGRTAPRLVIKKEKTQVYRYSRLKDGPDQTATILEPSTGADGLEYLGFRYDGRRIFLRNSTVSGFRRKISAVTVRLATNHVEFNRTMSQKQLIDSFNYNVLIAKFGRVKGFDFAGSEYTTWTFWTYIRRSVVILGRLGAPILRQINDYKSFARKKAIQAIQDACNHPKHP